jgi:GTP cyclohydrolase I
MKLEIPDELFNEEEIQNTPGRYQGFLNEWEKNDDLKFTTFENPGYDQLIILKDIDFSSLCSHHVLPFHGKAHVGYLPGERICGISKLARVVDKFASRPQIQEKMTNEIADFIEDNLHPKGCMVVVEAGHDCMRIRGVKKPASSMVTSAVRGEFLHTPSLKDEFMRLIA